MIRGKRNPVVHVIAYRKSADTDIQVTVTPDPLDMTQFAKGSHTITWKLDTKGFQFKKDGPAIEFTSQGWEKSFSDFKLSDCATRVTAHNKNRDGLAFAYNVRVVEKETKLEAFLDPVVQNNGE